VLPALVPRAFAHGEQAVDVLPKGLRTPAACAVLCTRRATCGQCAQDGSERRSGAIEVDAESYAAAVLRVCRGGPFQRELAYLSA
jgi:hypothetical protein